VISRSRLAVLAGLLLALPACGGGGDKAAADATPTPEAGLTRLGEVTPLRTALAGIAFRPFIPARQIVETALIPAYNGGEDTRENRGIAFEYVSFHQSYILSEWPGKGKAGPRHVATEQGCEITSYDIGGGTAGRQGALWSNGRIAAKLIPSGNASDRATFAEARRLVRLGACR
jgi:hypothetical protein